ncbi:MAG: hypothetical protein SO126_03045 [Parabacteroides distasonis]|nr:hypothetical protein [Parabacteroides distasonis]MDY4912928.1 hypothetical protein [Parabacteroides distasonis]
MIRLVGEWESTASCPEKDAISPLASPLVSYFGASPLYSIWSARGVTVSVLGWMITGISTLSVSMHLAWLMSIRIVAPDAAVTSSGEPPSLLLSSMLNPYFSSMVLKT